MTEKKRISSTPVLGVGDTLGAGDSHLVTNLLPPELADIAFERIKNEVTWKTMHHRGGEVPRLVAVEGEVNQDGSFPIYRHPADESPPLLPFSPTVQLVREHVQKVLNHPVNHVLIQFYRSGKDYISDHSDKTIDVVRGSNIVNVSLGAQRTMTLRLKKDKSALGSVGTPRSAQRIPLSHNSMFVMGLETNAKWLHGINHDNRPFHTKSPEEKSFDGGRISLTFRYIATFLSKDESMIWGQGATAKQKEHANKVVAIDGGDDDDYKEQVKKLLLEFGNENQQSDFDWDKAYGAGFDVVHLTTKET